MERDAFERGYRSNKNNFNSHAHVERDLRARCQIEEMSDFNSHAHVERDVLERLIAKCYVISTHTLTWSVTGIYYNIHWRAFISTHTLTWSVTFIVLISSLLVSFQLTRSRGA